VGLDVGAPGGRDDRVRAARIFFVLSLPRFVETFGSVEEMARHLVWLPTWHQACLLCRRMGIAGDRGEPSGDAWAPTQALQRLYRLIIAALPAPPGAA
jgi:hypothetical protein